MANLQTHLRAVLPEGIAVEATGIPRNHVKANDHWRDMLPSRCSEKRVAEFAVGRYCAVRALNRLGAQHTHVAIGEAREPCAPSGYSVSISHDDSHAVAVAAHQAQWPGLGIDIEPDIPLDANLVAVVCRDEELASKPVGVSDQSYAKRLFSIKESVFKAVFSRTGTALDWHQITVDCTGVDRFVARLPENVGAGASVEGISTHVLGKWASFASIS